jgi:uncharacterized protein YndB with AHSA1/START domain
MREVGTRPPDLSVCVVVRRTPEAVWDAVADPRRIASWSPEARGGSGESGTTGPLTVGTAFAGRNRNGVFRWSTRCVVVESTRGEAFAFDVTYHGQPIARWRYAFTVVVGGTRVEEQWWDSRGSLMTVVGAVGTGVPDRRTHNERTMRETLDALATDLEED